MPVHYSYTSTLLSACTVKLYLYSPQCMYSTAIPLLPSVPVKYSYTCTLLSACSVKLYLYSPQCLYSTAIPLLPSVPVQYSYTSTPLSACTVQLYLYSPYGPYSLYRASVPVQGCTLPLLKTQPNFFFDVMLTVLHLRIFISVINQLDAQNFCFTLSLFHVSTCFEHYTASGIITPIGGCLVHRLKEPLSTCAPDGHL